MGWVSVRVIVILSFDRYRSVHLSAVVAFDATTLVLTC